MSLRLLLAQSAVLKYSRGFWHQLSPALVVLFQFGVPAVWIAAVQTRPFGAGCLRWGDLHESLR
jgi:hypothetical protein